MAKLTSIDDLKLALRDFSEAREWDQFHSPKNLTMALAGEVGELLEHFQWLTEEQSRKLDEDQRQEVAHELADVLIYLVRIADKLGIDLLGAASQKVLINEEKYPVEKAKGSAQKYTEHQEE